MAGATWSATYNGVDLLSTSDPLSRSTSAAYGDANQPHIPTGFTDETGATWWATHNTFGQALTFSPPAGSPSGMSSVVYDESFGPNRGYPLYATDGNGDVVSFDSYDGLGDLTSVSTYPVHGNSTVKNTTGFLYDAMQRLIRVTNPDGTSSQAVYSGDNLSYTLDEKNTRYDYNYCAPCGLLSSIAGPLGWSLSWNYDADKDLTSFVDARGKSTTYGYGPAGDLNRVTVRRRDKVIQFTP
jgi:YD repeat-containing protein